MLRHSVNMQLPSHAHCITSCGEPSYVQLLHLSVLQVALVSLEEFAVATLPAARGAVALAVQHSTGLPVLLAVAVKAGKGRSKVLVFNVLPGTNLSGHQPAVLLAQVRWLTTQLTTHCMLDRCQLDAFCCQITEALTEVVCLCNARCMAGYQQSVARLSPGLLFAGCLSVMFECIV
jgi:hypothetical protein